jgi:uncharacterized protein YndB with AHSA1/START domain
MFENWGATEVEIDELLPGDDLIADPGMSATRSISLNEPPEIVFDWLSQMGFGKAGWYSYDAIDNLARPSATTIKEEWLVTKVGDQVPGGPIDFTVTHLDRPHHLVLAVLDQSLAGHHIDFTLAFRLSPLRNDGTRVVSRARAAVRGPIGEAAVRGLLIGDGIMVRRQLLGLAERCGRRR